MRDFVVLSVNSSAPHAKERFEEKVNRHLEEGYSFLGDPKAIDYLWVAFMIRKEDSV